MELKLIETLPGRGNITEIKISISFFLVHQANRTRFEFHKPIIISGYTLKNIPFNIISF